MVKIIDSNSLAILYAIKKIHGLGQEQNVAVVDMGDSITEINITCNGILRFTRTIREGGHDLTLAIKEGLNLDLYEAEAVKKESGSIKQDKGEAGQATPYITEKIDKLVMNIERSFDFYRAQFREESISKVILTGGQTVGPQIVDYIKKSLSPVQVEIFNPLEHIKIDKNLADIDMASGPQLTAAVGLGLRSFNER